MGRPSKFSQELADEIAERIAHGETLKSICEDDHMPNASTIFRWEIANHDFCKLLTHAREVGSHMIIAEAREIADDGRNDWMEKHGRDGQSIGWQINGEAVQRSRLRVDQRWKEATALAPRTFGQKAEMAVKHSGAIGIVNVDVSDDELVAEIMALVTTGRLKLPGGVELEEADDDELADEPDDDDFSDLVAPKRAKAEIVEDDDDDPYGVG